MKKIKVGSDFSGVGAFDQALKRLGIDYLCGKSVNGNPVIFPHEESVSYHVYHKVLNAKNYGVPQNRERVFIIGIRDDFDFSCVSDSQAYKQAGNSIVVNVLTELIKKLKF